MPAMRIGAATRNLAAFSRLAAQPLPSIGGWLNGAFVVLGISAASFLSWLSAPTTHYVVLAEGHRIAYPTENSRWAWAVAAGIGVVVILLLVAGAKLRGEVGARPRLVFAGTDSDRAVVFHGYTDTRTPAASGASIPDLPVSGASAGTFAGQIGPTLPTGSATVGASGPPGPSRPTLPENQYVRVVVKNEPTSGFGTDAEHVAAQIEFVGANGTALLTMAGRWAEAAQRLETRRFGITHEAEELTIRANGVRHELDIALKAPGDKHFYACNDENAHAAQHRLDQHRLDVAECQVHVTLRASNASTIEGLFALHNDGSSLTLTEVPIGAA